MFLVCVVILALDLVVGSSWKVWHVPSKFPLELWFEGFEQLQLRLAPLLPVSELDSALGSVVLGGCPALLTSSCWLGSASYSLVNGCL